MFIKLMNDSLWINCTVYSCTHTSIHNYTMLFSTGRVLTQCLWTTEYNYWLIVKNNNWYEYLLQPSNRPTKKVIFYLVSHICRKSVVYLIFILWSQQCSSFADISRTVPKRETEIYKLWLEPREIIFQLPQFFSA